MEQGFVIGSASKATLVDTGWLPKAEQHRIFLHRRRNSAHVPGAMVMTVVLGRKAYAEPP